MIRTAIILLALTTAVAAAPTRAVCTSGQNRCLAHIRVLDESGAIAAFAAPVAWGPGDLEAAYRIDPNISTTPTVALVDAYGYANLEADLAMYRAQFGIPACTVASGCLTIVNQQGQAAPLPGPPPATDDWTLETALDVDMVSAACPKCKILVVQAATSGNVDLYTSQLTAAALHPTVISDSWGGPEQGDTNSLESTFAHPGIAQFVAAGDSGWNDGGMGPLYPSTSANVISVGGTSLVQSATTRGWTETAWANAGSSCSNSIAKPAFQTAATGCTRRATTEVSAVADPETGLVVYNAANAGGVVMGGTSAAAPLVASIAAATGHGNLTAAQIVAAAGTTALFDVTAGANGTCSGALCNSAPGWDGPTGYGTPNAAVWAGGSTGTTLTLSITSPTANASVSEGFQITANATGAAAVGAYVDGVSIGALRTAPYVFSAPRVVAGSHTVDVIAIDTNNVQVHASVIVTVIDDMPPSSEDDGSRSTGCSSTHGDASIMIVLVAFVCQRRRRASR